MSENVVKLYPIEPVRATPVATGGDGPHDGGMEARISRLETDLGRVREDIATIKERTLHMPTTAALWKAVAVSSGAVIVALWVLANYLAKPWVEQLIHTIGSGGH